MYRTFLLLAFPFFLAASRSEAADPSAKPERIKLWNGHAPLGDGKFEEAEAWITLHKPEKPNGRYICYAFCL